MLVYKGFLRSLWHERPSPEMREQSKAISTPHPQALTNLSEKNRATKGRPESCKPSPPPYILQVHLH